MPFPLGRRTSSIQTQSASRLGRGGGGLNRTISLPADDEPLPPAGRRSNGGAQFNLEDSELPFPATSGQKLKFKHGQRLKVSWGRVSRKLAAGSTPSASLTGSYNDDSSDRTSSGLPNFPGYHLRRKKRRDRGAKSNGSDTRGSQGGDDTDGERTEDDDEVDVTVVDNDLFKEDFHGTDGPHRDDVSEASHHATATNGERSQRYAASDMTESVYQRHGLGCWGILRWRIWPVVHNFFDLSFLEKDRENSFQKEQWWNGKLLCLVSSLYLVLNWILYCALTPKPNLYDKILYFAVAPVLTVPTPIFVAFDVPRRFNRFWQLWIFANAYFWPLSQVVNQYVCGFYTSDNRCGGMDFVGQGYYAVGLPVLALFALGAKRFFIFLGTVAYIVLVAVLIIPLRHKFIRNLVNFIVFIWIFMILSYLRETMDRRISVLREQLKIQYKATQKAQIAERKSNNSKRRFVSYIFHEVRVPLNTALLALQTLEAMDVFKKSATKDCEIELTALQGSLRMMSQVLNDVLDFSRMESGRLEHVASSFDFHAALKSMLGALRVATSAKSLALNVDLDDRIDQIARMAAANEGLDRDGAASLNDVPALVIGDEMRLRQVVTNLASNACKFTPEGGTITITSKLVYPSHTDPVPPPRPSLNTARINSSASQTHTAQSARRQSTTGPTNLQLRTMSNPKDVLGGLHEKVEEKETSLSNDFKTHSPYSKYKEKEIIVVRIEVQDTGVGIRPKDMQGGRLFSAYVQTEIGKKQGGKGTGLGLALVRSIVQLSGGRLGVRSRRDEGSCFWVELPFAIGKPAVDKIRQQAGRFDSAESPTLQALSPIHTNGPKFVTVDVLKGPLRPIPAMTASFVHTESSYSRRSERSDAGAPLDEQDEGSEAHDVVPTAEGTGDPPIPTITTIDVDPPPSAPPALPPLRVLIVDDDPLTRLLMSRTIPRLVKDRPVITLQAENGLAALLLLLGSTVRPDIGSSSEPPRYFDCVFCDNSMPIMTGPQMLTQLRRHNRGDLVVGVTGNALKEDQEEFESAGVDFVLTKPVPNAALQRMIDMAIRRRVDEATRPPDWQADTAPTPSEKAEIS